VSLHGKPKPDDWTYVYDTLGDRQTVELLLNVGLYNLTARVTEPIELEDEVGFVPAPLALQTFGAAEEVEPSPALPSDLGRSA
jgi:hypothetical protein